MTPAGATSPRATTARPATEADRAFCWRLFQQTMRPFVQATWGWDEAEQHARFDAAFDPSARRIIEWRGAPIGLLHVDLTGTPVRLLNLQIAPVFQHQGHGSAIITALAREAGHRPLWLQVLKVNPARSFYERAGFRMYGETDTHWQMLRDPG
ncbi:MAG: N-acetyltransferase [Lysobacter sp.]|nr:MAG: N-acetyltransferase [Lysobacter sp.]